MFYRNRPKNSLLTEISNQLYLQALLYVTNHVLYKILIILLEKIIANFSSRNVNNFVKHNFIQVPHLKPSVEIGLNSTQF